MIPKKFLTSLASQAGVSQNELDVLAKAIAGESLSHISKQLGVRQDALQKRMGEVYKKFNITGAGPGKLAKLQQILLSEYQKQMAKTETESAEKPEASTAHHHDRQPVPPEEIYSHKSEKINNLIDRTPELQTLSQWILKEKRPLIVLLGTGGIGKTSLVQELSVQLQSEFEHLFWQDLGQFKGELSDRTPSQFYETNVLDNPMVAETLRTHRCLLILDNVETLLNSPFPPSEESWGDLQAFIHSFTEARSQSSCILISREPLEDLGLKPVKTLKLEALSDRDAQQFLFSTARLTHLEPELASELVQLYQGNPLALQIVGESIHKAFQGNLMRFTAHNSDRLKQILREVCPTPLDELEDLEQQIINWLAVNGTSVTASELHLNLNLMQTGETLQHHLEELVAQTLVESLTHLPTPQYALHTQVREAVVQRFLAKHFNQIGQKKYLEGELLSAKLNFCQAIRFYAEFAHAHYNLGSTYEQLDNIDFARFHYQQAAQLNNKGAYAATSNLTRLAILDGQFQAAKEQASAIIPQVKDKGVKASLYKNIGWAELLLGNAATAEENLRKSLELDRDRPIPYGLLAQALEAQKRTQEARDCWATCLKLDSQLQKSTIWRTPELRMLRLQAYQRLQFPDIL